MVVDVDVVVEVDETRERSESSRSFSSWAELSLGRFGVALVGSVSDARLSC